MCPVFILSMSATERSYTQNFLKFNILLFKLYLVELDEKIIVADEKIFRVRKAFDRER